MGGRDLLELPATLLFDVIYSLVLEDTRENAQHRNTLDAHLASVVVRTDATGKPDRATWGRLPHQQEAMRAAQSAAG